MDGIGQTGGNPTAPSFSSGIPWKKIALGFLLSRLLLLAVGWITFLTVPKGAFFRPGTGFADSWQAWDADWYLSIVNAGYSFVPGHFCNAGFFPLYPLLVRVVSLDGLWPTAAAGYVVSNLCLGAACVVIWRLVKFETASAVAANWAVAFVLAGPVAHFFAIIYSESLFLLLAASALFLARRGQWWAAGICGAGLALSRSVGVFISLVFLVEYAGQLGWRRPQSSGHWLGLGWCALPVAGLGAHLAYLAWKFGEPLAYFKAQAQWGRYFNWPWMPFVHQFGSFQWCMSVGALVVAGLLLALLLRRRVRCCHPAFVALFILLYLSSNRLEAMPRYLSVLVPLYLAAGLLVVEKPAWRGPLLALSLAGQLTGVTLFVNGYWFT